VERALLLLLQLLVLRPLSCCYYHSRSASPLL